MIGLFIVFPILIVVGICMLLSEIYDEYQYKRLLESKDEPVYLNIKLDMDKHG